LKKRSKKLFLLRALAVVVPQPAVSKSFFASFFSKKEVLCWGFCVLTHGLRAGLLEKGVDAGFRRHEVGGAGG
jgi:hypothetical protein